MDLTAALNKKLSGQNLKGRVDFGNYKIRENSEEPLYGELGRLQSQRQ